MTIKYPTKFSAVLLIIVILHLPSLLLSQNEFQLVESVPEETILEQSALPRTLDVWLNMINSAKTGIDIETFYFANQRGQPLEKIVLALKNAAGRGVQIRIIVDSSFYSNNDKSVDELNNISNIQIKKIPVGNISGGVMHAKFFIVDDEDLFLGSQNMDWRALIHIHEIGVRVKSKEIARTFKEVFETDWKLCDGNYYGIINQAMNYYVNSENPVNITSAEFGKIILYPAFSPNKINMPGLSSEEDELIKLIGNTSKRLFIHIYSYSPRARGTNGSYTKIDSSLRAAAKRGVKIKIILPDWAIKDYAIDFIKDLSLTQSIEIKFSTIPQHSSGFIPFSRVDHTKYFIADDNISWISTSNWEWSYFHNSRNATLIIDNKKVNEELEKVFNRDWNSPYSDFIDVDRKYESVKRN